MLGGMRWGTWAALLAVCACGGGEPPVETNGAEATESSHTGDEAGEYVLAVDPWGGEPGVSDLTPTAAGGVAIHRVVESYSGEGEDAFLVRHELDSDGRPVGPARRVADMPPMAMDVRTALVGESTLVVVVFEPDEGGFAYTGLWLDAEGAPRGDRFPIAETTERVDESDLFVVPDRESRARVIVSTPNFECARDGEVDTQVCPSWAHYGVPVDEEPSELEPPDGNPDFGNVMLAGSERGVVYIATGATFGGGIPVGIQVEGVDEGVALEGFGVPEIEGFLIGERVAILAVDFDAERRRIAIYGADGAEYEEEMTNGVVEVPLGSAELGCDGDVPVARARMQAPDDEVVLEVHAGDRSGSAPWHLWMSDTSVLQLRSASTARAVYTLAPETEPGELLRTRCVGGERIDDRVRWMRAE